MSLIKFEDLLDTGAHFGHVTRKWHPNYKPYILMEKNGVHIINLEETISAFNKAVNFIQSIVKKMERFYLLVPKNKLKILFSKKLTAVECSTLLSDGLVDLLQILLQ